LSKALVSVIVPAFNRLGMLPDAVDSVLAQSYRPIEVILIDDGSDDGTWTLMQSLAERHTGTIYAWRQDNAGPGAARNLGLKHASGDYVQYLDSDDLLEPEKFEVQVRALQESPGAALAYGETRRIDMVSGRSRVWARTSEHIDEIFPGFLMQRGWDTNSPLWRRSACEKLAPWLPLRCMEDWEHDLRAGLLGFKPVRVPNHVATVRDHGGDRASAMNSGLSAAHLKDTLAAHASIWNLMQRFGKDAGEYMQPLTRKVFALARDLGRFDCPDEADTALAMALDMAARSNGARDIRFFAAARRLIGWRRALLAGDVFRRLSPNRATIPAQR